MILKMGRRPWTSHDLARAKTLRAQGHSDLEIDRRLGRRPGSTNLKFRVVTPVRHNPEGGPSTGSIRAPDHVLAERDARRDAADRRDLTAAQFNDPPPGFSELDRRKLHVVKPMETE
jgi:hypothetical protein